MFIQTETTPNPLTLKFIPGVPVVEGDPVSFQDKAVAAKHSPFAEALLTIKGVASVFFGSDFISITRAEQSSWELLKPELLTTIMEHFVSGRPVLSEAVAQLDDEEETDPLVRQIKELIDTRVRPAVAQDGGDIIFRSYENGIVKLEMHGACSGCPSSTVTLKNGVENMLRHYIPEIVAVEAVA